MGDNMYTKKLKYINYNICRLVDKRKLKLHYKDEFDFHKKRYNENICKINKIEKKTKKEKLDTDNLFMNIPYIPDFPCLSCNELIRQGYIDTIGCDLDYWFIKNKCKFIQLLKDESEEYAILIMDGFVFGNVKLKDINILQVEDKILEDIEPYLLEFNMVKEKYVNDDLGEILNLYINTKKKNKQLVK